MAREVYNDGLFQTNTLSKSMEATTRALEKYYESLVDLGNTYKEVLEDLRKED